MATIKDVAERAGVSVATVSRVLNRAGNVLPVTELRVQEAITALCYSPNLLGRNLRQGETRKILILVSTFSNQFYSRVIKGVEAAAATRGYAVMVGATHGSREVERGYLTMLQTRLLDGLVFLTVEGDGETLDREMKGFPVVQACEPQSGFLTPRVSIDNEAAGQEAAAYLLDKGHWEIAYFGAPGGEFSSSARRESGFRRGLAARGVLPREEWILHEGFSVNAGIRSAHRILGLGALPTAIFCASDSCAAGAINAFAGQGLRVPENISVLGFDNTQLSEVFLPSITTMRQPQFEIGQRAAELLFQRIDGTEHGSPFLILPHEIMERNSVIERKQTEWKK